MRAAARIAFGVAAAWAGGVVAQESVPYAQRCPTPEIAASPTLQGFCPQDHAAFGPEGPVVVATRDLTGPVIMADRLADDVEATGSIGGPRGAGR